MAVDNVVPEHAQVVDTQPAEGTCLVDDYKDLEHVVVPSADSQGYDIRCYKETQLIIENLATGKKKSLAKLFISIKPHVSLILNVMEPEWIEHLIQMGQSRWENSQTSKGLVSSHPVGLARRRMHRHAGLVQHASEPYATQPKRGFPIRRNGNHITTGTPRLTHRKRWYPTPRAARHGQIQPRRLFQGAPRWTIQIPYHPAIS